MQFISRNVLRTFKFTAVWSVVGSFWRRPTPFFLVNCLTTPSGMATAVGKVDSKEFKAVLTPELFGLSAAFSERGFDLRIVGGAVRDLLLGKTPKDVDLSTSATPNQMIELFSANGIRYIETGLQHGTLTVHMNKHDFEVTTLRVDTETDGRHAKVTFTNDWRVDAERRDLTINAMSLALDGTLYDYFGGQDDLKNRVVKFVGDPRLRIREDYLRILRYFRFYGRIAVESDKHNQATLDIIRESTEGLRKIAVERIWVEIGKILTGNHAPSLLRCMYELGVSQCIGKYFVCYLVGDESRGSLYSFSAPPSHHLHPSLCNSLTPYTPYLHPWLKSHIFVINMVMGPICISRVNLWCGFLNHCFNLISSRNYGMLVPVRTSSDLRRRREKMYNVLT